MVSVMSQPTIVLLTGPPGGGKGTQADLVAERYGWRTFSVGQLLRDSAPPEVRAKMNAGDLLPKEQVVGLVMAEIVASDRSVLVDGFPRRLDQAHEFDRLAQQRHLEFVVAALLVSEQESWRRVSERGRDDDARTSWEHRWQEYQEHTEPAIEHYRERGQLRAVNGEGSVEAVATELRDVLGL